jgi:hypothetical protein
MATADQPEGHVVRPSSSDLLVAAPLRSLGFEKVTVGFEQPPAT